MKRIIVVLAAMGLLAAALLPAAPAQAAGAGLARCNITVDPWPGSGSLGSSCTGEATGVFVSGTNAVLCTPLSPCSVNASVDNYGEACFLNEPPLVGDAEGTLTISNGSFTIAPDYDWTRVGVVAVITTTGPTGAGVAAFIPRTVPLPTCAVPGPLNVDIAGLAVFS